MNCEKELTEVCKSKLNQSFPTFPHLNQIVSQVRYVRIRLHYECTININIDNATM